jgi:transposase
VPPYLIPTLTDNKLTRPYRQLIARGKHANVVTVAIARELAGFMWAIAKEV